jgi:hypothetical protein
MPVRLAEAYAFHLNSALANLCHSPPHCWKPHLPGCPPREQEVHRLVKQLACGILQYVSLLKVC